MPEERYYYFHFRENKHDFVFFVLANTNHEAQKTMLKIRPFESSVFTLPSFYDTATTLIENMCNDRFTDFTYIVYPNNDIVLGCKIEQIK